ncbi:MAG: DUF6807 family protein [Planctomycetota bacterium]
MRWYALLLILSLTVLTQAAAASGLIFEISDPDGAAARSAAPVSIPIDFGELFGDPVATRGWHLEEIDGGAAAADSSPPVAAQFEPDGPDSKRGTLWWIMPKGPEGNRRFRLALVRGKIPPVWQVSHDTARQAIDLIESSRTEPEPDRRSLPVLRYNIGNVPVREGTHPHFAEGESYERGDYIHPLFGPDGEEVTEDYPRDHPHHRGVWWSWPVTRWGGEIGDIWAVVRVWSRPVAVRRLVAEQVMAVIEAENVWKFGKGETPIVREEVLIRAFRQTDRCRFVDVEVRLTALEDDVAIGGRPKAGYGGFSLRAAPCEDRKITLHTDPEGASPRRSWLDYSGAFAGGKGPAGVTIFEHVSNPDYPNPLHEYGACNCVMPAYPEKREVVLSKEKPLVLKHRLWIHAGGPDENALADAWTSYANPPQVTIAREQ